MDNRIVSWLPDWVGAGLVAGMLWGGWAFFANYEHGFTIALKALCAQGVMSFTIASFVTSLVAFFVSLPLATSVKFSLGVLVPVTIIFCLQLSIHLAAGTPNIITTIFPSVSTGGVWCFIYARKLLSFENEATLNE